LCPRPGAFLVCVEDVREAPECSRGLGVCMEFLEADFASFESSHCIDSGGVCFPPLEHHDFLLKGQVFLLVGGSNVALVL
jgi:hypothetical protein